MSTSKFAGELLQTAVAHNIEHLQEAVERFIIYHNRNNTFALEIKKQFEEAFAPLEAFVENLDEQRKIIRAHTNDYFVSGNLMAKLGFEDLELEDYLEAQAEAAEAPRAPTADEHFAAFEQVRRTWDEDHPAETKRLTKKLLSDLPKSYFQNTFIDCWRAGEHVPGWTPADTTIVLEYDLTYDAFAITEDDLPAFFDWYVSIFDGPDWHPEQTARDYLTENGVSIHLYFCL